MSPSMISSALLLQALLSVRAHASQRGAAAGSGALRVELSPDGEAAFDTAGDRTTSDQGARQQWLERLAEVGPLGDLKTFFTGSKRPPPLRQRVNGSTPTGPIEIGTPAVMLDVIFDTGSDRLVAKTWDTVRTELGMLDRSAPDQIRPTKELYDHNSSSTYVPEYVSVGGSSVQKRGFVAYGSGVAITDEGKDTVTVAGHTMRNFTVSEITADSLTVLHAKRGVAGVLGLQHMKNRTLGASFFTLCRDKGMLTSFGYCRGKNDQGTFIWGDTSTEGTAIPVVGQIHWAVRLSDVLVQGQEGDPKARKHSHSEDPPSKRSRGGGEVPSKTAGKVLKGGADMHSLSRLHYRGSDAPEPASKDAGFVDEYVAAKYAGDATLLENTSHAMDAAGGGPSGSGSGAPGDASFMCPGGKCVSIIDTGSNIIARPLSALKVISRQLAIKYDCSNVHQLPPLHMTLGGFKVSLPSSSYVMKVKLPRLVNPLKPSNSQRETSYLQLGDRQGDAGGSAANESEISTSEVLQEIHRHFHENYGLDLRTGLDGVPLKTLLSGKTLCMPAFVPLDKETADGPLWVVGTPLFDNYYVRWSWPQGEPSPKIFIKDLSKAGACEGGSREEDAAAPGPGLLRSEARGGSARPVQAAERLAEAAVELPEWGAEEIRFPHWARHLDSL